MLQGPCKAFPACRTACNTSGPRENLLLCTTKSAQNTSQFEMSVKWRWYGSDMTWNKSERSLKQAWKLLRTTKLAQSSSQYYFALQSIAQSTSQYYFVLHALHKVLPSTTLYYKSASQHHFGLQGLHEVLPSTTLYYKACTKYFPELLL